MKTVLGATKVHKLKDANTKVERIVVMGAGTKTVFGATKIIRK